MESRYREGTHIADHLQHMIVQQATDDYPETPNSKEVACEYMRRSEDKGYKKRIGKRENLIKNKVKRGRNADKQYTDRKGNIHVERRNLVICNSLDKGMHLRLRPANNAVYNDVCVAQYYADSPVFPVEFFGRLYQIPLLRVYRKHDRSLQGSTSWIKQQVTSSE
ncbi:hypothetical protein L9F63_016437, partial [Diploptera punctata]